MSDFYRTYMGQRFFESTVPGLVKELHQLNLNLERLLAVIEQEKDDDADLPPIP